MPFFKDTVALETCPAKTAESVSYGATFAVLAWLLLSNYSGLGNTERESQSIASTDSPPTELSSLAAFEDTDALADPQSAQAALPQLDSETQSSNFVSTAPAWHAEIEKFQLIDSQPNQRAFSIADWSIPTSDASQQIEGFIAGLDLPLPFIDIDYLFKAEGNPDAGIAADLASNALGENELVREITVTGAATERLSRRPDNAQRPQIPRPYRAQEIPRSFVLPPRIQALRP